jgi:hypothetical protein
MTTQKKFKVEYACDADGDHSVPVAECTTSGSKEFDTINGLLDFIAECSYVFNKDRVFGSILNARQKPEHTNTGVTVNQKSYETRTN